MCFVWHDSFVLGDFTLPYGVTWLIHTVWHDSSVLCDMTHSYCVTWLICIVWHDSFIDMTHSVVWLQSSMLFDVTHSYCVTRLINIVWHDSFMWCALTPPCCVTRLFCYEVTCIWVKFDVTFYSFWPYGATYRFNIQDVLCILRDMAHSYFVAWPPNICVTWLTVWDKCLPLLIHVTWLIHTVTWLIHIVWHDSFILCDMTPPHCVTRLIRSAGTQRWAGSRC